MNAWLENGSRSGEWILWYDATSNILKKESFTIFYVMASVAKIASQDKILILLVVFDVKRHTQIHKA